MISITYMPEEGMVKESELIINQASHVRYLEDFLKFIDSNEPMLKIMKRQVIDMVRVHIRETFEAESMELWATSEKRELQERLDTHPVMDATWL